MGNVCFESRAERLEIINQLDLALQQNMEDTNEVPDKDFAKRVHYYPQLNPKVLEILKEEFLKQPFTSDIKEQQRGKALPLFLIHKQQLYYLGQWKNKLPHGKGKIYFPQGHYFQGFFVYGEAKSSNGIFIFNDGSYYRGQIQNSQLSGKGRFVSSLGTIYQGQWKNNKPEGQGKQTFSNGNQYIGHFVNGVKQGKGIFRWADDKIYDGYFKNGKMNGEGKLYRGQSQSYEGIFQNNKKIGSGIVKTAFGTYTGQFSNGQFSGKGKFVWNDKKKYEGGFKNGKMDGQGILTFPNGTKIKGVWNQGIHVQNLELDIQNIENSQ